MLLIAVGCDDSTETEQPTEQGFDLEGSSVDEQPDEAEQPTKPVHSDLPVIELPSFTNTLDTSVPNVPVLLDLNKGDRFLSSNCLLYSKSGLCSDIV